MSWLTADRKQRKPDLERSVVTVGLDTIWSDRAFRSEELDSRTMRAEAGHFYEGIQKLSPQDNLQRSLQAQALQISTEVGRIRSLLLEQRGGSIPMPFLVVLIFWLAMIFASFGLFAPPNSTVVAVLCVCALSVAGAIFLILELDGPFQGFMRIPNEPVRNALRQLGQ